MIDEHALKGRVSILGAAHLQSLRYGDEKTGVELSNDEEASSSSDAKG